MTQVILLERVEKLGQIGDVVDVKPGFARNYLLPQGKAMRASNENIAYFEAQKKTIEADNDKKRKDAEKNVRAFDGVKVPLIRQASEAGQLFGSVTSRDIAEAISEATGQAVTRGMIDINRNFKMIGLFPVTLVLHPEVRTDVMINIARSAEEAKIQADTGRALIADNAKDETIQDKVDADEADDVAEKEVAVVEDADAIIEAEVIAAPKDEDTSKDA